jgi:hypothetical protein
MVKLQNRKETAQRITYRITNTKQCEAIAHFKHLKELEQTRFHIFQQTLQ